ncbi:hypothetical protein UFOVP353_4 [uncultured Caudovirales phage]|uniref:Uncharacterized protein n=1 Tax=uncultured Caudovirales phage TaxID=2100421 RepID=A0A6J5LYV2_9CAUD|nr:hypothetical protein UFOVP353_4 [uncultured Caudovirales phage]
MTVLTIIQDTCGRLGLQIPAAIFSSTDEQVIQFRSLLNASGKSISRIHDWTFLKKEHTFTTVAADVQTGGVPSDFDRYLNHTMFNRTRSEKIYGPLTNFEWQVDKGGFAGLSIRAAFRFRGGDILITPVPTAGDSIYYEFITKNWCESASGTAQEKFQADTDISLIDEELLTKDITWRFLKAKGLDYSEEFQEFQVELANFRARDGGARIIDAAQEPNDDVFVNIPDGNWTL